MSYIIHSGACDIYLRDKLQGTVTNPAWQMHTFFFPLQFTSLVISQLFNKTCLVKPQTAKCVDITITRFHFLKTKCWNIFSSLNQAFRTPLPLTFGEQHISMVRWEGVTPHLRLLAFLFPSQFFTFHNVLAEFYDLWKPSRSRFDITENAWVSVGKLVYLISWKEKCVFRDVRYCSL